MVICCIGDSLTEGDYGVPGKKGIANVHEHNYPYFLAEMTHAEVRNFGRCGWRASHMLEWYRSGEVNVRDADAVIIMLGTNGGQSTKENTPDNRAYRELVSSVRRDAPSARIFLCTPPNATVDPAYSNCGYAPQVREAALFVRALAKELCCGLIDLAHSNRLTPENEPLYQSNDGLHCNEAGYRVMAEEIYGRIME